MKRILFLTTLLLTSTYMLAQTVTINESGGWLETAYVKWQPATGASSYNVYYSGEGITNQKIDTQLIRCYADGSYRADVLGLKAGSYTISVVPVIGGSEGTASITGSVTVQAHDRTGYAFMETALNPVVPIASRIPGAYNLDGTPQNGAVIVYITEDTKDTVELDVAGASPVGRIGLQDILEGFKKGVDSRPIIIRLIGQITDPSNLDKGDIVIENKNNINSHITLEGVGDDAVADGWGIRIKNASNIEIRNIGSMNCNSDEGDNIGLQQGNDHIWVHNVDFFYGDAGGDADQAKGDGALDCKKSTYVTFSYNHFWDSGKSNLLGLSENGDNDLFITYHHNWYDHSDSRHPRVRYYTAHVYNNYYDGNSKYGVGSTLGSSVFVENNYFRNCKYPILTSLQGTDIFYGYPTFSGEDGGSIKAFGNTIIGATRFDPYGADGPTTSTIEFDAVVTATRNETIPNAITSKTGGNTYNNFDTDSSSFLFYSYTPDTPEDAKTKVMQFSGRMHGGDFECAFDQPGDDTSSTVNTPLKAALVAYTTNLVCVQGINEPPSSQTLTVTTSNADQNVTEGNAIDPIVFTWGGDATDANVTGLPASGITFVKNITSKTITVSGTPTANVSFSVSSSGSAGTPVNISGNITVGTVTTGDEIHNFTESGKTSAFYSITGSLSTSKGTAHYNGLDLTQCLKMESSTNISFTTSQTSTLTLVLNDGYSGSLNIDGVPYNGVNGIITLEINAGIHAIQRTSGVTSTNLYYMSVEYSSLGIDDIKATEVILYPNPVTNSLHLSSKADIEKIRVYSLLGVLVKSMDGAIETIDVSNLNTGSYLVKIFTSQGVMDKMIVKN
tara:strand:- start:27536 stop:30061 length:2526 start_codon:yes stop_codon:yes gene_type:complete